MGIESMLLHSAASRIKLLPSSVRDGNKRWPGQAVRVSNRAGLVNLDIINTPLT